MACSLTWLYIVLVLILIFVVFATALAFIAPSFITTPTTASSTATANNTSARSLLYGAGAVGVVAFILLFVSFYASWITIPPVITVEFINMYSFGTGTIILSMLLFLLLLGMLFLIIYAITLIDVTNNTSNTNGRWWAGVAAVFAGIAFLLVIISWFLYYSFNRCLAMEIDVVKVNEVIVEKDYKPFQVGPFTVVRNKTEPGQIQDAHLTLDGKVVAPQEHIVINGVERVNELAAKNYKNIDYKYNVSDVISTKPKMILENKDIVPKNLFENKGIVKQVPQKVQFKPDNLDII
ncbi:MAG TPA: hypothetical protein VLG50_08345 [Candidatus Saccharimonadales bacterium]|nr:hypothetical protein [Candidatus Saccharimonadales bacterium]